MARVLYEDIVYLITIYEIFRRVVIFYVVRIGYQIRETGEV